MAKLTKTVSLYGPGHPREGQLAEPNSEGVRRRYYQTYSGTADELNQQAAKLEATNGTTYGKVAADTLRQVAREMRASRVNVHTYPVRADSVVPGVRLWVGDSEWAVVDVWAPCFRPSEQYPVLALVWTGRGRDVYPVDMRNANAVNPHAEHTMPETRTHGMPPELRALLAKWEELRCPNTGEPFNTFRPDLDEGLAEEWRAACDALRRVDWTEYDA